MKIKTALKTILSFVLLFSLSTVALAQLEDSVNVSTYLDDDLYSQVSLDKTVVELREITNVNIRMLDPDSNPLSGRSVEIYIDGYDTGISITQPTSPTNYLGNATGSVSSSSTGSYVVCVQDNTDIIPIYVEDCETLFVVPLTAPTMAPEPQYTQGSRNTVSWNHSGSNTYEYQVQVSRNSEFTDVVSTSDWISPKSYEFRDLLNNQLYFYRARARNEFGGMSDWSGSVYSIQDSEDPSITTLNIGTVGENTVEEWDNSYVIPMTFRVKDNVGISNVTFFCVLDNGTLSECASDVVYAGDILSVNLELSELEKTSAYQLFEAYGFCVEASDTVGNVKRECNIEIEFPKKESPDTPDEPDEPDVPIIPPQKVKDDWEQIVDDVIEVLDDTIGQLSNDQLQITTVTTATATITVGVGAFIISLGYLPYILIELGLSLLSFLGFRKKGNLSGYVYDSVTKEPISQAIVRIFDVNNSLVWTDVTDGNGYFMTPELKDDEYMIKAVSRAHTFPSKIVFGKDDFPLENVYHGSLFYVKDKSIPNFSIPMDPHDVKESVVRRERILASMKWLFKSLHLLIFLFGLVFSVYALYTNRLWWNYLIVFLYIPSFILLVKSIFGEKEKWGVVKDVKGDVLEDVVVGLTDVEFDRLVSKRVTNQHGKYRFVVEKGRYKISLLTPNLKMVDEVGEIVVDEVDNDKNVLALDLVVEDVEKKKKEQEVLKKKKKLEEEEKKVLIELEDL